MPTYTKASEDVCRVMRDMRSKYHPDLIEAEVTIEILMAQPTKNDAGEITSPAIRLHGYPCQATIRKTSLRDRVAGLADAVMVIDEENWEELSDAQKAALIDHELYHLQVKRDEESGDILADDHGRPKLMLRLHDWEVGGFETIARRHADASPEKRQVAALVDEFGQTLFDWMAGSVNPPPPGGGEKKRGRRAS